MQYYARLRPEATKCEFHSTDLEIKRHLQEAIRNWRLPRKVVRDRYTLEKFLEEAQAEEESERNEQEILIRSNETEDAHLSVNKIGSGKFGGKHANRPLRMLSGTSQGRSHDKKKISKRSCGRCALVHESRKCPVFG